MRKWQVLNLDIQARIISTFFGPLAIAAGKKQNFDNFHFSCAKWISKDVSVRRVSELLKLQDYYKTNIAKHVQATGLALLSCHV